MAKGKFPWCTVITVIAAIVCHILVLLGNLQTAQTLHAIGQGSSGWSDVGLSLGGSLRNELDALMHFTVEKLTGALDKVIQVENDIDVVLGKVANATDAAIAEFSSLQISGHNTKVLGKQESDEPEVSSLLQSSADVCEDGKSTTSSSSASDELASLLQGKVHMQLVASEVSNSETKQELAPVAAGTSTMLHAQIEQLVERIKQGVHELLEIIKPALLQIGKWLQSMGPKMQGLIEEMSIVIDRVQKIIDEIMSKIAGPGTHSEEMLYHVFALFDVDESGYVSQDDILKVSDLYGITALQHTKGRSLLEKYDVDKDGQLSKQEFSLMIDDESIPKAASVTMRTYSRRLSEVAGAVAAARLRDEVAHSVVDYFSLVCSKNRTKLSWVSQMLTNETLPIEFVADVLKQFVESADSLGTEAVLDVGGIVIKEMMRLNGATVQKAVDLVGDPGWWHSSGFDAGEQPRVVEKISEWVLQDEDERSLLQKETTSLVHGLVDASVLQTHVGRSTADLTRLARDSVLRKSKKFHAEQRMQRIKAKEAVMSSETSASLFRSLLGSRAFSAGGDPDAARVVSGGVQARPETLQFAQWLANNASSTSDFLQHLCFKDSHSSSSTVDAFATQIQGMLKKTQNFLNLMKRYSTPEGVKELENRINGFLEHAVGEAVTAVNQELNTSLPFAPESQALLIEKDDTLPDEIRGYWKDIMKFTQEMKSTLPTVVEDIKFARKEVAAVSQNMLSVFPVFKVQGPPLFEAMRANWATMWTLYFVVLVIMSLFVLFYGFWASGYFGGPDAQAYEDVPPGSLANRCISCFRACNTCFDRCPDTQLCFWSAMLFAMVIIVIMWFFSTMLSIVACLKMFMAQRCQEIYILNDNSVCFAAMKGIQSWLSVFWHSREMQVPLTSICESRTLLVCRAISAQISENTIYTIGGSFLAAFFTVQMILESAWLHEKALWTRMLQENALELEK